MLARYQQSYQLTTVRHTDLSSLYPRFPSTLSFVISYYDINISQLCNFNSIFVCLPSTYSKNIFVSHSGGLHETYQVKQTCPNTKFLRKELQRDMRKQHDTQRSPNDHRTACEA